VLSSLYALKAIKKQSSVVAICNVNATFVKRKDSFILVLDLTALAYGRYTSCISLERKNAQ